MELEPSKIGRITYRYVLTCMDGFSKYAYCFAHSDEKPEHILESLKQIFDQYQSGLWPVEIQRYKYLWIDKGSEFTEK